MLLDEDPATLIHHTIGNFNITPDKLAVSRINESLSTLQQARDLRVREAESALKKLSRTLQSLNTQHSETLSTHSSTAHASSIASLDTQKFRIAKSASDLEIETERLSSQLADLQGRLQELEVQGVEGGENARRNLIDDEISLKLKVYRGLGIDLERGESGEYEKAIVRSGRRGDVNVVNIDGKFSRVSLGYGERLITTDAPALDGALISSEALDTIEKGQGLLVGYTIGLQVDCVKSS